MTHDYSRYCLFINLQNFKGPSNVKSNKNINRMRNVFSSVAQSCLTLCDPMDCSTPGLPVHHQLPEFTQSHVHWLGDAIQLSHPLLSPSLSTFKLSQHQGLFRWVSSSHQVAKVLELQLQHHSFQWIFQTDFPLGWIGWISLQSKGLSRVLSNSLALSLLCGPTLTSIHDSWKNHSFDYTYLCWQNDVSVFNMLFRFVIAFLPRCTNAKEAELNGSMRTYKTF